MFLYCFWGIKNDLKADKTCKILPHLNICLHYYIFIWLHAVYEHSHLTPGTSYSVMNVRVAAQMLSTHNC